jgi:hypothetical protein
MFDRFSTSLLGRVAFSLSTQMPLTINHEKLTLICPHHGFRIEKTTNKKSLIKRIQKNVRDQNIHEKSTERNETIIH